MASEVPAPKPSRALLVAELILLVAAGVFALSFHLRSPGFEVDERSYQEVARVLEAEGQGGDAVLLFPWWTERARLFLPERFPIVGYLGSDADDLAAHPRVWVLSQPRLPRADEADFARQFSPGREALGPSRRFGNLALRLYQNGRHVPRVLSAADALSSAQAYLETEDGERLPCAPAGASFLCPNNVRIAREWHEVHFQPRHCIYTQPPGGPTRVVLELVTPPAAALQLEAGLVWDREFHRGPGLTPLHVGVDDASGETLVRLSIPPGLEGLQRAKGPGTSGTLRLWVQSDQRNLREACIDLFAVGSGGDQ